MKKTIITTTTASVLAVSALTGVIPAHAQETNGLKLDSLNTDVYMTKSTVEAFKNVIDVLDTSTYDEFVKKFNSDITTYKGLKELDKQRFFDNIKYLAEVKSNLSSNKMTESEAYDTRMLLAENMNKMMILTGVPISMLLEVHKMSDLYYHAVDSIIKGTVTEKLNQLYAEGEVTDSVEAVAKAFADKNMEGLKRNELHFFNSSFVQERTSNITVKGYMNNGDEGAYIRVKVGNKESVGTIKKVGEFTTFEIDLGKMSDMTFETSATDLGEIEYEVIRESDSVLLKSGKTEDVIHLVKSLGTVQGVFYEKGKSSGLTSEQSIEIARSYGELIGGETSKLGDSLPTVRAKIPSNNPDIENFYIGVGNYLTALESSYKESDAKDMEVEPISSYEEVSEEPEGETDLDLGTNTGVSDSGSLTYKHPRLEDSAVKGLANPYTDTENVFSKNEATVLYYAENGIMKGSQGKFNPNGKINRGHLAAVLARVSPGMATVTDTVKIPDLKGTWYAFHAQYLVDEGIMGTVEKEANNKVIEKDGATTFLPNENVQRKDLAVVLKRYLASLGVDTSGVSVEHVSFNDVKANTDMLSDEEIESIALMESLGIFHGTAEGKFDPFKEATRAQLAKVMYNTLELVGVVDVGSLGGSTVSTKEESGTTENNTGAVNTGSMEITPDDFTTNTPPGTTADEYTGGGIGAETTDESYG